MAATTCGTPQGVTKRLPGHPRHAQKIYASPLPRSDDHSYGGVVLSLLLDLSRALSTVFVPPPHLSSFVAFPSVRSSNRCSRAFSVSSSPTRRSSFSTTFAT